MRTDGYEMTGDLKKALRAIKTGKRVVLTMDGVPVAMLEGLIPASKEEEGVIVEMIESGALEPSQKSGMREWKWRRPHRKAA